ncbi:hypothetical protein Pmani_009294 [Petrolisthes manimaculis]|uniref:Uncharacterized protein n=1 Tax=Petrolisthes manimaculis TaxID=1843537 RepID=A0AAE1Q788_9EUCA|nr:hypothetical protein Pmani_009294 [Petrolisthes manimaculis]
MLVVVLVMLVVVVVVVVLVVVLSVVLVVVVVVLVVVVVVVLVVVVVVLVVVLVMLVVVVVVVVVLVLSVVVVVLVLVVVLVMSVVVLVVLVVVCATGSLGQDWDTSEWRPIIGPCPTCRQARVLHAGSITLSSVDRPPPKRSPVIPPQFPPFLSVPPKKTPLTLPTPVTFPPVVKKTTLPPIIPSIQLEPIRSNTFVAPSSPIDLDNVTIQPDILDEVIVVTDPPVIVNDFQPENDSLNQPTSSEQGEFIIQEVPLVQSTRIVEEAPLRPTEPEFVKLNVDKDLDPNSQRPLNSNPGVQLVYLPEGSLRQLTSANAARIKSVSQRFPTLSSGVEDAPPPPSPESVQDIGFSDKQKRDHNGRVVSGGITNALAMSLVTTQGQEKDAREKLRLLEAALTAAPESVQENGRLPRVFIAPSHVPPPPGYVKIPLVPQGDTPSFNTVGEEVSLPQTFLTPDDRSPPPGFVKFDLPARVSQLSRNIPVVVPNSQVGPSLSFTTPPTSTQAPTRPPASINFETQVRTGKTLTSGPSVQVIPKGDPKQQQQQSNPTQTRPGSPVFPPQQPVFPPQPIINQPRPFPSQSTQSPSQSGQAFNQPTQPPPQITQAFSSQPSPQFRQPSPHITQAILQKGLPIRLSQTGAPHSFVSQTFPRPSSSSQTFPQSGPPSQTFNSQVFPQSGPPTQILNSQTFPGPGSSSQSSQSGLLPQTFPQQGPPQDFPRGSLPLQTFSQQGPPQTFPQQGPPQDFPRGSLPSQTFSQQGPPQDFPRESLPPQTFPQQGPPQDFPRGSLPSQTFSQGGPPPKALPQPGPPPQEFPQTGPPPKTFPQTGPPPKTFPQTGPPPKTFPQTGPPPKTFPQTGPPPKTFPQRGPPPKTFPQRGPPPPPNQPSQSSQPNQSFPPTAQPSLPFSQAGQSQQSFQRPGLSSRPNHTFFQPGQISPQSDGPIRQSSERFPRPERPFLQSGQVIQDLNPDQNVFETTGSIIRPDFPNIDEAFKASTDFPQRLLTSSLRPLDSQTFTPRTPPRFQNFSPRPSPTPQFQNFSPRPPPPPRFQNPTGFSPRPETLPPPEPTTPRILLTQRPPSSTTFSTTTSQPTTTQSFPRSRPSLRPQNFPSVRNFPRQSNFPVPQNSPRPFSITPAPEITTTHRAPFPTTEFITPETSVSPVIPGAVFPHSSPRPFPVTPVPIFSPDHTPDSQVTNTAPRTTLSFSRQPFITSTLRPQPISFTGSPDLDLSRPSSRRPPFEFTSDSQSLSSPETPSTLFTSTLRPFVSTSRPFVSTTRPTFQSLPTFAPFGSLTRPSHQNSVESRLPSQDSVRSQTPRIPAFQGSRPTPVPVLHESPRTPSFQRPQGERGIENENLNFQTHESPIPTPRPRIPSFSFTQRPRVNEELPIFSRDRTLTRASTTTPAPTTPTPTTTAPTTSTFKVTTFKPRFNFNVGNRRPFLRRKPRPDSVLKKENESTTKKESDNLTKKDEGEKLEETTLFPPFSVARTLNPQLRAQKDKETSVATADDVTVPPPGIFGRRLRPRTRRPGVRGKTVDSENSDQSANDATTQSTTGSLVRSFDGGRTRTLVGRRQRLPNLLKNRRRGRFRQTTVKQLPTEGRGGLQEDVPVDELENNRFNGAESTVVVFSSPPENKVVQPLTLHQSMKVNGDQDLEHTSEKEDPEGQEEPNTGTVVEVTGTVSTSEVVPSDIIWPKAHVKEDDAAQTSETDEEKYSWIDDQDVAVSEPEPEPEPESEVKLESAVEPEPEPALDHLDKAVEDVAPEPTLPSTKYVPQSDIMNHQDSYIQSYLIDQHSDPVNIHYKNSNFTDDYYDYSHFQDDESVAPLDDKNDSYHEKNGPHDSTPRLPYFPVGSKSSLKTPVFHTLAPSTSSNLAVTPKEESSWEIEAVGEEDQTARGLGAVVSSDSTTHLHDNSDSAALHVEVEAYTHSDDYSEKTVEVAIKEEEGEGGQGNHPLQVDYFIPNDYFTTLSPGQSQNYDYYEYDQYDDPLPEAEDQDFTGSSSKDVVLAVAVDEHNPDTEPVTTPVPDDVTEELVAHESEVTEVPEVAVTTQVTSEVTVDEIVVTTEVPSTTEAQVVTDDPITEQEIITTLAPLISTSSSRPLITFLPFPTTTTTRATPINHRTRRPVPLRPLYARLQSIGRKKTSIGASTGKKNPRTPKILSQSTVAEVRASDPVICFPDHPCIAAKGVRRRRSTLKLQQP